MSMKCVGGLNHKNKQRPTSYTNNIHSQVPEGRYQGGCILMTDDR